MEKQLPQVQEIFAEAFIELQKDISEESARSFQLTATADDPLALLLDDRATVSRPPPSFRKQKKNNNFMKDFLFFYVLIYQFLVITSDYY